ncbi:MAG TPA: DUF6264 family protein [Homoserinimonas sp.]|nr:DUF6264 family protein [Homoserinimonas sp.]
MSESETPRPRAQYGEFATPEEQQRARGVPERPSEGTGEDPQPPAPEPAQSSAPAPLAQPDGPAAEPAPAKRHPVDRVVTLVLLAFGLFLLLNSIPGYLALPEAMQTVYDQLDAGSYPATEVAASLGVTALVVQSVIWIATAASAWFAMKRGRLAWWIALVGGVLAFIAMMVIVSIALFADPGFIDNISPENLPRASF